MPIFRSQHQAALLAWLLMHPEGEYTLTDLAQQLGAPLTTVQREAGRLVDAGLLRDRSLGRARLLSANTEHRAAAPLTQLLEISFGPQVVVAEEFVIPDVERVLIFGSWAERFRGAVGQPPRDVDVLLLGAPVRSDVYDAADRSQVRLGMPVNPVVRTVEQWDTAADPLVIQIRASEVVDVTPDRKQDAL